MALCLVVAQVSFVQPFDRCGTKIPAMRAPQICCTAEKKAVKPEEGVWLKRQLVPSRADIWKNPDVVVPSRRYALSKSSLEYVWQKAKGNATAVTPIDRHTYWYRDLHGAEPEISLHDPFEGWEVGLLESGCEYFYNARIAGADGAPHVLLTSFDAEEVSEADAEEVAAMTDGWRIAELPSGRQYLWRNNPDDPSDPEVRFWREAKLESGKLFWYDEGSDSNEIVFDDPFSQFTHGGGGGQ